MSLWRNAKLAQKSKPEQRRWLAVAKVAKLSSCVHSNASDSQRNLIFYAFSPCFLASSGIPTFSSSAFIF